MLLISGASGVGKSTARVSVAGLLGEEIEAVELGHFGPIPPVPTRAWRQQTVELAVRRAIELEGEGRHLLLAGDPVPAGEVLAAPSAGVIDIAVCLFDADVETQTARLRDRHDPEQMLVHHIAFASWLREHATDPSHAPEVLTANSWEEMRWDRWDLLRRADPRWAMSVIDTSGLDPDEVAREAADWCRSALEGTVPVFRAGWSDDPHQPRATVDPVP